MLKTDREIAEAVVDELRWDTRIDAHAIEVRVDRGGVTMVGSVCSWAERLAAQEAAQRVAGVHDVSNRIEVALERDAQCTDAELAQAVRTALDWDVFLPKKIIASSVSAGQVMLEGEVECCPQRDEAERAVRNIRGVRRVLNRILVKPTLGEAYQVQKSIEAALERRAARGACRINLDVHDGKVILSGVVNSWAERQWVVGAAKGTLGVRSVDDRLSIELPR
ncbi:MAG TPA: BON domain-containing protein [Polyangiaceae bacterium]|nr:BON domain-containing protein [Polyangiaceae bacterium]